MERNPDKILLRKPKMFIHHFLLNTKSLVVCKFVNILVQKAYDSAIERSYQAASTELIVSIYVVK